MNTLKSAWAIAAGLLAVTVLSTATDFLMAAVGFFPSVTSGTFTAGMLAAALVYRVVFTILGGYVTAALAPRWPMRHVIVLGILGTMAAIAGVVTAWGLNEFWYPVAILITGFPAVWYGGYLRVKRAQNTSS